jgi:hypothetical protein
MRNYKIDYNKVVRDVLSFISFDGLGYDDEPADNTYEAAQKAHKEFMQWYEGHREGYFPTVQDALSSYLSGLPSWFNAPFYNCDILELARDWGSLDNSSTDKDEDKILENYWNFMAVQLLKVWRKSPTSGIYVQ